MTENETLWCPPKPDTHSLPNAYDHKFCIMRCGHCGNVFQSQETDLAGWPMWFWRKRSERWLKRKMRKYQRMGLAGDQSVVFVSFIN